MLRSAISSAWPRALGSRSSRFVRRAMSARSGSLMPRLQSASLLLEGNPKHASRITAMQADRLLDGYRLTIVCRRSLDQALAECAQLAPRAIPQNENLLRRRIKIEDRHIRPRVDLTNLGVDDGIEREYERTGIFVRAEETRVFLGEQWKSTTTEPTNDRLGRGFECRRSHCYQFHQLVVVIVP